MNETSRTSLDPTAEQIRYSGFLEKGMYFGLALLLLTFAVYVTGILDPYLPMEDLPVHWTKGVHDYLEDAQIEPGWAWLSMIGYGDFLNWIPGRCEFWLACRKGELYDKPTATFSNRWDFL